MLLLLLQGGSSNPKGGAGRKRKGNKRGDPVAAEDQSDRRPDDSRFKVYPDKMFANRHFVRILMTGVACQRRGSSSWHPPGATHPEKVEQVARLQVHRLRGKRVRVWHVVPLPILFRLRSLVGGLTAGCNGLERTGWLKGRASPTALRAVVR
jgi:hypothetical protein